VQDIVIVSRASAARQSSYYSSRRAERNVHTVIVNIRSAINSFANNLERTLRRETLTSLPTILQVEITSACNLSCSICARARFPYGPGNLLLDLFRSLVPLFPYLQRLILHGYGEPLAHPKFSEIMDIVAPYSCEKSFYSNGTLLFGKRARAVLAGGMTEIAVSIDSPDKRAFESIRRGASFDRVVKNVTDFTALRDAAGRKTPRVVIAAVAMTDNVKDLPALVDLAARCRADTLEISYLMAYEEALVGRSLFFDKARANAALERVTERARALGVETRLPAPFTTDGEPKAPAPQDTCPRPYDFAYVGYDGNVRPCCFPLLYLGTIKEEPFGKIWNGAGYRRLRRAFAKDDPPPFCRACLSGVYTDVDSEKCHVSCEHR
jgi:MoaA/NifB/PqqE/SkfB family radical SAM enzyme